MSDRTAFIDRRAELASLERAWRSGRPQLVLITGRRRVGKSALLVRFARGKRISFIAAAQRLRKDQLADAAQDIAALANGFRVGRPPTIRLDDWDALLDLVAEQAADRRCGIIIDEFPYLVAESPDLPSLVQRWWDRTGSRSHAFVVLAGSHQAVMRDVAASNGPLYGRATVRRDLAPLDYYQAARFVPAWSPDDRVRAYAVAGGMPEYLRLLDDRRTLRQNLEELAFVPDGPLFREAEYLFESEFREVSRRGSIFRAIARGATTPNGIAQSIGLGSAADVAPNLRDLVVLGLIERVVPVTEEQALRQRRVLYRIGDPYLRFYFALLDPRRGQIALGPASHVSAGLTDEELDVFVSRTFESVARSYVSRLAAVGDLPILQRVGTWWRDAEEIDVVGIGASAKIEVVGGAKWQASPMDGRDVDTLERRAALVGAPADVSKILVSRSGFHSSARRRAGVRLVTTKDLFAARLDVERAGMEAR